LIRLVTQSEKALSRNPPGLFTQTTVPAGTTLETTEVVEQSGSLWIKVFRPLDEQGIDLNLNALLNL
jgi:hypothetical protein